MYRLLILSCSQRKRLNPGLLVAVERYDGPVFRVLRRYLRTPRSNPPDLYIISAEFGLIPGDLPIPWYDRRMTRARAAELRPSAHAALAQAIEVTARLPIGRVFVSAGNDYAPALPLNEIRAANLEPIIARGRPGERLSALRHWLDGG